MIPILMYHRVADLNVDPHRIAVSPVRFRQHMKILADRLKPIGLTEAVEAMSVKTRRDGLVSVTFDDGYADNAEAALSVLEEFGVPATIFVATGGIDSGREFWWDEVEALLLGPHSLPDDLSLHVGGRDFRASLTPPETQAESLSGYPEWSARDGQPPPTPRHSAYLGLLEALRGLDARVRSEALDALHTWADRAPAARDTHRALTSEGVRLLAVSDQIEIGAHSVSHPALSGVSPKHRWNEIMGSRRVLETLVGPIRHFAYPFGDWRGSKRFVQRAGFRSACVTASRQRRRVDRFRLGRFYVGDWDEDVFLENLTRWQAMG